MEQHTPTKIFISYRRSDSQDVAGRIYDWLIRHIPKPYVYFDVQSRQPGPYPPFIHANLLQAHIVLVIIGPQWATIRDGRGERRLLQADDWVRQEIALALEA